jgi:hypothetical protein
METIGTVLLIGIFLDPIYWIWDNSGGGVLSLVMAILIGGGALIIFVSMIAFSA